MLPAGTALQIAGSGFDASTTVAIDGVAVSCVDFVNAIQLNVTLGGATEMTGKHIRVTNSEGAQIDYYAALPSAPTDPGSGFMTLTGVHPILPFTTVTATTMGDPFATSAGGSAAFATVIRIWLPPR